MGRSRRPSEVYDCSDNPVAGRTTVEFIDHAVERLGERGISPNEVIDTIRSPDEDGLPTDEGRSRCRRLYDGGLARRGLRALPGQGHRHLGVSPQTASRRPVLKGRGHERDLLPGVGLGG